MVKQNYSSCCAGNRLQEARVEARRMLESIVITQARDGGAVELVVGAEDRFRHGLLLEILE